MPGFLAFWRWRLQFGAGGLRKPESSAKRFAMPQNLKLAFANLRLFHAGYASPKRSRT